jgi:hypothetical protein
MKKTHGTKAAIAAAVAAAAIVLSAGVALAAPVLQPGVTSAPGMSGNCASCHRYAKPAAAMPKPMMTSAMMSQPRVPKQKQMVGVAFSCWGYIAPKLPNTHEATVTITVQRWTHAGGSWVATSGLNTQGMVSATGQFKGKTNYHAKLKIGEAGRYRMRAKLVWMDAKGVKHTTWSKRLIFRVHK